MCEIGDRLSPRSCVMCLSEVSLRVRVEQSSSYFSSAWCLAVEPRLVSAQDRRWLPLVISARAWAGFDCVAVIFSEQFKSGGQAPSSIAVASSSPSTAWSLSVPLTQLFSASSRVRAFHFRFLGFLNSPLMVPLEAHKRPVQVLCDGARRLLEVPMMTSSLFSQR